MADNQWLLDAIRTGTLDPKALDKFKFEELNSPEEARQVNQYLQRVTETGLNGFDKDAATRNAQRLRATATPQFNGNMLATYRYAELQALDAALSTWTSGVGYQIERSTIEKEVQEASKSNNRLIARMYNYDRTVQAGPVTWEDLAMVRAAAADGAIRLAPDVDAYLQEQIAVLQAKPIVLQPVLTAGVPISPENKVNSPVAAITRESLTGAKIDLPTLLPKEFNSNDLPEDQAQKVYVRLTDEASARIRQLAANLRMEREKLLEEEAALKKAAAKASTKNLEDDKRLAYISGTPASTATGSGTQTPGTPGRIADIGTQLEVIKSVAPPEPQTVVSLRSPLARQRLADAGITLEPATKLPAAVDPSVTKPDEQSASEAEQIRLEQKALEDIKPKVETKRKELAALEETAKEQQATIKADGAAGRENSGLQQRLQETQADLNRTRKEVAALAWIAPEKPAQVTRENLIFFDANDLKAKGFDLPKGTLLPGKMDVAALVEAKQKPKEIYAAREGVTDEAIRLIRNQAKVLFDRKMELKVLLEPVSIAMQQKPTQDNINKKRELDSELEEIEKKLHFVRPVADDALLATWKVDQAQDIRMETVTRPQLEKLEIRGIPNPPSAPGAPGVLLLSDVTGKLAKMSPETRAEETDTINKAARAAIQEKVNTQREEQRQKTLELKVLRRSASASPDAIVTLETRLSKIAANLEALKFTGVDISAQTPSTAEVVTMELKHSKGVTPQLLEVLERVPADKIEQEIGKDNIAQILGKTADDPAQAKQLEAIQKKIDLSINAKANPEKAADTLKEMDDATLPKSKSELVKLAYLLRTEVEKAAGDESKGATYYKDQLDRIKDRLKTMGTQIGETSAAWAAIDGAINSEHKDGIGDGNEVAKALRDSREALGKADGKEGLTSEDIKILLEEAKNPNGTFKLHKFAVPLLEHEMKRLEVVETQDATLKDQQARDAAARREAARVKEAIRAWNVDIINGEPSKGDEGLKHMLTRLENDLRAHRIDAKMAEKLDVNGDHVLNQFDLRAAVDATFGSEVQWNQAERTASLGRYLTQANITYTPSASADVAYNTNLPNLPSSTRRDRT